LKCELVLFHSKSIYSFVAEWLKLLIYMVHEK
jgi:hypothetical protein